MFSLHLLKVQQEIKNQQKLQKQLPLNLLQKIVTKKRNKQSKLSDSSAMDGAKNSKLER